MISPFGGDDYRDEPVNDGFLFHKPGYPRPGQGWAPSRHKKHLQRVQLVFTTRYADGGLYRDQTFAVPDGRRFAIVIFSDGRSVVFAYTWWESYPDPLPELVGTE